LPFGSAAGDSRLPSDSEDISSAEVPLSTNVKFFAREYGSVYVRQMHANIQLSICMHGGKQVMTNIVTWKLST
jgi:hypothetical protein